MVGYGFEQPPTAYTRDAADLSVDEHPYAMVEHLKQQPADCELVEYKRDADGEPLHLHVFGGSPSEEPRACALLFHGGGWSGGEAALFHPAARYLASRGDLVTVAVQYQLYEPEPPPSSGRPAVTVFDCVRDCRDAMAYVRAHAAELGVDPDRVSAHGDSAGGHLSLMLGYPEPGAEGDASRRPADAVVSYNPVADLETDNHGVRNVHGPDRLTISPAHLVQSSAELPSPTLLMHGKLWGLHLLFFTV